MLSSGILVHAENNGNYIFMVVIIKTVNTVGETDIIASVIIMKTKTVLTASNLQDAD